VPPLVIILFVVSSPARAAAIPLAQFSSRPPSARAQMVRRAGRRQLRDLRALRAGAPSGSARNMSLVSPDLALVVLLPTWMFTRGSRVRVPLGHPKGGLERRTVRTSVLLGEPSTTSTPSAASRRRFAWTARVIPIETVPRPTRSTRKSRKRHNRPSRGRPARSGARCRGRIAAPCAPDPRPRPRRRARSSVRRGFLPGRRRRPPDPRTRTKHPKDRRGRLRPRRARGFRRRR